MQARPDYAATALLYGTPQRYTSEVHLRVPHTPCFPAARYLKETHPFWERQQGRDHIFWLANDRGACYLDPNAAVEKSIKLLHFSYNVKGGSGPIGP